MHGGVSYDLKSLKYLYISYIENSIDVPPTTRNSHPAPSRHAKYLELGAAWQEIPKIELSIFPHLLQHLIWIEGVA